MIRMTQVQSKTLTSDARCPDVVGHKNCGLRASGSDDDLLRATGGQNGPVLSAKVSGAGASCGAARCAYKKSHFCP